MEIKIYCNEIYLDCILVDLMLSTYNVQKGIKMDLNINDWILKIQLIYLKLQYIEIVIVV